MVLFRRTFLHFRGGEGVQYIINTVPDTNMTPNYARKQFGWHMKEEIIQLFSNKKKVLQLARLVSFWYGKLKDVFFCRIHFENLDPKPGIILPFCLTLSPSTSYTSTSQPGPIVGSRCLTWGRNLGFLFKVGWKFGRTTLPETNKSHLKIGLLFASKGSWPVFQPSIFSFELLVLGRVSGMIFWWHFFEGWIGTSHGSLHWDPNLKIGRTLTTGNLKNFSNKR